MPLPNKELISRLKDILHSILADLDKKSIALWTVSLVMVVYSISQLNLATRSSELLNAFKYELQVEKQSNLFREPLLVLKNTKNDYSVSKSKTEVASSKTTYRRYCLEEFCNGDPDYYTQNDFSNILHFFNTECYLMPETESLELFRKIMSVAESVYIDPRENDWHDTGFEILQELGAGKGKEYEVKLIETWLEVIKAKHGEKSGYYRNMLHHYMYIVDCKPEEVERVSRALFRQNVEGPSQSNAVNHFNLANELAREGLGAKAEVEWKKGVDLTDWSDSKASLHACVFLIKTLRDAGFASQADRLVDTLLSKSRPKDLGILDELLGDIYEIDLIDGNFEKATTLVERRLTKDQSSSSALWQIRRSNLMLLAGKTKESDQLFQKAVSSIGETGKSTAALKAKRLKLVEHWEEWRGSKLYDELTKDL